MSIIAIDGPAGSGKSTTARLVAKKLGFIYIDTGAMYRVVAYATLKSGISIEDETSIANLASNLKISFREGLEKQLVFLNNEDVSKEIRTSEVSEAASIIAIYSQVRKILVEMQQRMGKNCNAVMEGRDIGTVVFPQAELKIFLIATYPTRACRRQRDLIKKGEEIKIPALVNQLKKRDKRDKERQDSPLKKAPDAVELDTTLLTINEQVDKVVELAKVRLNL